MEAQKSIVILCAGGPAPGMNTVVATVAKCFLADGYKVLGMNYGYKTLFSGDYNFVDINYELADRIYDKGGSYLKMSRHKPKDNEFNTDFFVKYNVKLLVTVGGDDTASTANRLSIYLNNNNIKIQNIHVPKTIDNDLPLPGNVPTFGYQTAKAEGVHIGKTITEDARTNDTWFVMSAMGREAGHLALGIAVACHSPIAIFPEMFYKTNVTFEKIVKLIVSSMIKRKLMGMEFGVAVISEGVFHFITEEDIKNCGIAFSYDEHGHPELGKISKSVIFNELVQFELKKLNLKIKSRPEEVGYELRCVPPIAYDLRYCTKLGQGVKYLFDRGAMQCIVLVTNNDTIEPLHLKDISGADGKVKPRLVDVNSELYKVTLDFFETIKPADYEAAKKYVSNPAEFDLKNILNL